MKTRKVKEPYLKLPLRFLKLPGLQLLDKLLLAHFHSFADKGCWQSNATLAKIFMCSERTISRCISTLKQKGLIRIHTPKGFYRKIWATSACDSSAQVRQKRRSSTPNPATDFAKFGNRVRHVCLTTNNNTIKENYTRTTATPPPLPACGQAPALPAEGASQVIAQIEAMKNRLFRRPRQRLSAEQLERRREQLKAALFAAEAKRKQENGKPANDG